MDAQTIQFYASVIQAIAALVFLGTVLYWPVTAKKLREERRRDGLENLIMNRFHPEGGKTDEELYGSPSPRQIKFFNEELRKMGEKWKFPRKRV